MLSPPLNGHSWVLHVSVRGSVNADTGFVQDFAEISNVVKPLIERLDHRHLGAWGVWPIGVYQTTFDPGKEPFVEGLPHDFYPTSENLLWWIASQLNHLDVYSLHRRDGSTEPLLNIKPGIMIETSEGEEVELHSYWSQLSIEETCTSMATLTREEYNLRAPHYEI